MPQIIITELGSLEINMIETSGEIKILLIGWLLGIFTSIVQPFIITPIKKWQDKRNFKKILKADIKLKIDHLKSIEQRIIDFVGGKTLDDAVNRLIYGTDFPVVRDKIPEDIYKTNYAKILDYFNKENNLLDFYQCILTLNQLADIMINGKIKGENYRLLILGYCTHLKHALNESKNISI